MRRGMELDRWSRAKHRRRTVSYLAELATLCRRLSGITSLEESETIMVDTVLQATRCDFVAYLALTKNPVATKFCASRGHLSLSEDIFSPAGLRSLLQEQGDKQDNETVTIRRLLSGAAMDQLFSLSARGYLEQGIALILAAPEIDMDYLLLVGFAEALVEPEGTIEFLDASLSVATLARRKVATYRQFKSEHGRVVQAKREWQCSVDVVNQLICLVDQAGRIVRANKAVEHFGLGKVADVRGKCFWDVLAQLDRRRGAGKGHPMADWCAQAVESWAKDWQSAVESGGIEWVLRDRGNELGYCISANLVNLNTPHSRGVEAHAVVVVEDLSRLLTGPDPARAGVQRQLLAFDGRTQAPAAPDRRPELLSDDLLNAQEEERTRVALELHDGIGQMLTMMKLQLDCVLENFDQAHLSLDQAERLKELRGAVGDSINEVHRISMNLRPPMLDDLGIGPTLRWFFREFMKANPALSVAANIEIEERLFSKQLESEVFRVTQEAMNNVVKHADASEVQYELQARDQRVFLVIQDNGVGFEGDDLKLDGAGFNNMRTRVTRTGGCFTVEAAPAGGVKLMALWPAT